MTVDLMADCVLVLVVSIVVCMAIEFIDSWVNYGKANKDN